MSRSTPAQETEKMDIRRQYSVQQKRFRGIQGLPRIPQRAATCTAQHPTLTPPPPNQPTKGHQASRQLMHHQWISSSLSLPPTDKLRPSLPRKHKEISNSQRTAPGMHQTGRDLRGGWRRLSKRLGAVTVGRKCPLKPALAGLRGRSTRACNPPPEPTPQMHKNPTAGGGKGKTRPRKACLSPGGCLKVPGREARHVHTKRPGEQRRPEGGQRGGYLGRGVGGGAWVNHRRCGRFAGSMH